MRRLMGWLLMGGGEGGRRCFIRLCAACVVFSLVEPMYVFRCLRCRGGGRVVEGWGGGVLAMVPVR